MGLRSYWISLFFLLQISDMFFNYWGDLFTLFKNEEKFQLRRIINWNIFMWVYLTV